MRRSESTTTTNFTKRNSIKVTRMTRMGDNQKTPVPLMLIHIPQEEKNIINLRTVVHLCVTIETLKSKSSEGQCYNCQKYGHAQNRCHATPMCMKCGRKHSSQDCVIERSTSANYGNCQGNHPANYGACPENARIKKIARSS